MRKVEQRLTEKEGIARLGSHTTKTPTVGNHFLEFSSLAMRWYINTEEGRSLIVEPQGRKIEGTPGRHGMP